MSHTTQHAPKYTKENPPLVTRNGITLPLTETVFGKTSNQKGKVFWTLEANSASWQDIQTFIGESILIANTNRSLRKVGADIFTDEKNTQNGVIQWSEILSDWAEFDTGGSTLKDLNEDRDALTDSTQALIDAEGYQVQVDATGNPICNEQYPYGIPLDPTEWAKINVQIIENNKRATKIKFEIKRIQGKYEAAAAKRQASTTPKVKKAVEGAEVESEQDEVTRP
jgi:hypothetical protein